MPEPAIRVKDLGKIYRDAAPSESIRAVDHLSVEIGKGQTYGLIGPNGAGKTTLLRILATLTVPTFGRAHVAGYDCDTDREEVCKRIGFMPELFALYEEMKVWEYLDFFAGAYGVPRAQRARIIDEVMELTDLQVRRDSQTGTLSKGMRQRLLLAKTLIHDPDVLLLDEPTSGMDPQARIEFRNIVLTLQKMGKSIIISSHILSDLSHFCTSLGIMECGRMRISGTIEEIEKALELRPRISVEFIPGDKDVRAVLETCPGVESPRVEASRLEFSVSGGPEDKAAVLAALVKAGVRVTRFAEKRSDLEDIFLQVGATQVQ